MTKEQIRKIDQAFKHSDDLVFTIDGRAFVAEVALKHRKEATVEMVNCQEIDETCFEPDGSYYGETLEKTETIILRDPFADEPNMIATIYYADEIVR